MRTLTGKDCKFKFFCAQAGILLADNWANKVQCNSERIIFLKMIISRAVFTLLSVYAPQTGRPELENKRFYDQLQYAVAKVSATEILIPVGDWNGHVGAPAGVFSDAHGGHGFGTHNMEGERILDMP